jgi:hypothetical protein
MDTTWDSKLAGPGTTLGLSQVVRGLCGFPSERLCDVWLNIPIVRIFPAGFAPALLSIGV